MNALQSRHENALTLGRDFYQPGQTLTPYGYINVDGAAETPPARKMNDAEIGRTVWFSFCTILGFASVVVIIVNAFDYSFPIIESIANLCS
jgi:hypothetical protein